MFSDIIERFPPDFRQMTYLEVFGGGGYVVLNKPRSKREILNDYNSDLINLYRQAREHPKELQERLRYVLNCREDFKLAVDRLRLQNYDDMLDKAADFYQVFHQSYGAAGKSFGATGRSLRATFPDIDIAAERLQNVVVENWDFERVFLTYDSPETISYLDPPYFSTEKYYGGECFPTENHEKLRDLLLHAQGLWFLSYNYCDEIMDLYCQPGFYIEHVQRLNNMVQKYRPGEMYDELFITNYDTTQVKPDQLVLFDLDNRMERRNYLWR